MEWFEAHITEVFAAVGAVYAAARLIVALTPTPKDDAVVGKIGAVVRLIAATMGLTLNQGIGKKPVE